MCFAKVSACLLQLTGGLAIGPCECDCSRLVVGADALDPTPFVPGIGRVFALGLYVRHLFKFDIPLLRRVAHPAKI